MGILKEKDDKIDSLYMTHEFDESCLTLTNEGLETLSPQFEFSNGGAWDYGRNSKMHMMEKLSFIDKGYFETFTMVFPRDLYRI